jgi:hypothetical protein
MSYPKVLTDGRGRGGQGGGEVIEELGEISFEICE